MIGHLALFTVLFIGAIRAHDIECSDFDQYPNEICCGGSRHHKQPGATYKCVHGQLYKTGLICAGVFLNSVTYPNVACCGGSIIYDPRTHICDGQHIRRIQPPVGPKPPAGPRFIKVVCGNQTFYIENSVVNWYKCCGNEAYDITIETCQVVRSDVAKLTNQIIPKVPNVPHIPNMVLCNGYAWILATIGGARNFYC